MKLRANYSQMKIRVLDVTVCFNCQLNSTYNHLQSFLVRDCLDQVGLCACLWEIMWIVG